ncbi:MAG: hypothetical protein ACTSUX_12410 [Promethearchaeota archaeon]
MRDWTVILVKIFLPFILLFLIISGLIKNLIKKEEEIKIIKPLQIPKEFFICSYCSCSISLKDEYCPYCGSLIVSPSSARNYPK